MFQVPCPTTATGTPVAPKTRVFTFDNPTRLSFGASSWHGGTDGLKYRRSIAGLGSDSARRLECTLPIHFVVCFASLGVTIAFLLSAASCGGDDGGDLFPGGKGGDGTGGGDGGSGNQSGSGGGNTGGGGGVGNEGGGGVGNSGGDGGTGNAAAAGGSGGALGGAAGTGGASGGAGGGTGGTATGGSGGTGGAVTLDSVCSVMPGMLCAPPRESCCNQGVGYDKAQCLANEKALCDIYVSEVKAGNRTFRPEKLAPCVAALEDLYKSCVFSGEQAPRYYLALNVCQAIFDGKASPGDACTYDNDCQMSPDANGFGYCATNNQCTHGHVVGQGQSCEGTNICAAGHYCKFNTGSPDLCEPAVPLGGACSSSVVCGLGYYCISNKCAPALPGGAQCFSDYWCKSLACANGKCNPQWSYATAAECGK
jgi:hypothetical protein